MGKNVAPEGEKTPGGQAVGANNGTAGDPNAQLANVHMLDDTVAVFNLSKKSEGIELFDKVTSRLQLSEKDYFALSFTDAEGNKHWLCDDKKISKQIKNRPWEFNFEVKFYPPDPATLSDDLTRYQLCLQVRRDVYTGRLPATLATHALLGSYVAQSERGDYECSPEYEEFLKSSKFAPVPSEMLFDKVRELHKQHKGETSAEAEMHYLENAKKLSMYGVILFPAKDGKGMAVQIGVCAHGINIYRDQIRVHRFIWQNIIKIAYRRNVFTIKLRPGELEKNETTVAFKLGDYGTAKRVWNCAVEHHTFFRLIQPDEKPHRGLFRWGSAKFRFQGRTQFQSKMASQMFDHPVPAVQRSHSARLASRNDENVAPAVREHKSPLHYADDGASRDLTNSPEKSYSVDGEARKEKKTPAVNDVEVGHINDEILDGSSALVHDVPSCSPAVSFEHPNHSYSLRFSPYSAQPFQAASYCRPVLSGQHPDIYDAFGSENARIVQTRSGRDIPDVLDLAKESDLQFRPVHDAVIVYHPGHYEEMILSNNSGVLSEPPFEKEDDIVFIQKRGWGKPEAGGVSTADNPVPLKKVEEIGDFPIRYFVDLYHSGFPKYAGGNRDFDRFERTRFDGAEEVISKNKINKSDYPKSVLCTSSLQRTEREAELCPVPLRACVSVCHTDRSPTEEVDACNGGSFDNVGSKISEGFFKLPQKGQSYRLKSRTYKSKKQPDTLFTAGEHRIQPEGGVASRQFQRVKHVGDVEIVDKSNVKPETYGVSLIPFEGPIESIFPDTEVVFSPIKDFAAVYHSGYSIPKTRKALIPPFRFGAKRRRSDTDSSSESSDDAKERGLKKKAVLHLKGKSRFSKRADLSKGPKDAVELESREAAIANVENSQEYELSPDRAPNLIGRLVNPCDAELLTPHDSQKSDHLIREGETETLDNCNVKPDNYIVTETSYDGPLMTTSYETDHPVVPIQECSAVYHSGLPLVKRKEPRTSKHDLKLRSESGVQSSSDFPSNNEGQIGDRENKHSEADLNGGDVFPRLYSSSTRRLVDSQDKNKSGLYDKNILPLASSECSQPVESVPKSKEFESEPWHVNATVKNSSVTSMPKYPYDSDLSHRLGQSSGEGATGRIKNEPQSFALQAEGQHGPVTTISRENELAPSPIRNHVSVYHPGSLSENEKQRVTSGIPRKQSSEDSRADVSFNVKKKGTQFSMEPAVDAVKDKSTVSGKKPKDSCEREFEGNGTTFGSKIKDIDHPSPALNNESGSCPAVSKEAFVVPIENICRTNEFDSEPLRIKVLSCTGIPSALNDTVNHSHGRIIESDAKKHILSRGQKNDPYKFSPILYEGPIEKIEYDAELPLAPIYSYSSIYHPGTSFKEVSQCDLGERMLQTDKMSPTKQPNKGNKKKAVAYLKSKAEVVAEKQKAEVGETEAKSALTAVVPLSKSDITPEVSKKDVKCDDGFQSSKQIGDEIFSTRKTEEFSSEPFVTRFRQKSDDKADQPNRVLRDRCTEVDKQPENCLESYGISFLPFHGVVGSISKEEELKTLPLKDFATVYHSGNSYESLKKPRRPLLIKHSKEIPSTGLSDGKGQVNSDGSVKTSSEKTTQEIQSMKIVDDFHSSDLPSSFVSFCHPCEHNVKDIGYESLSPTGEIQSTMMSIVPAEGPLGNDSISQTSKQKMAVKKPRLKQRLLDYRLFQRAGHEGEIEYIDKTKIDLEKYNLLPSTYEGPLEQISRDLELHYNPIQEHASVYHPGVSFIKSKKSELSAAVPSKLATDEGSSSDASTFEDSVAKDKKTAVLYLKGDPVKNRGEQNVSVTDEKYSSGTVPFFHRSGKKLKALKQKTQHSIEHSLPPSSSARYDGVVNNVSCSTELPFEPLQVSVDLYDSALPKYHSVENTSKFRSLHKSNVGAAEKENAGLGTYQISTAPYEGPVNVVEKTSELDALPTRECSAVHHPGQSDVTYSQGIRDKSADDDSSGKKEHKILHFGTENAEALETNEDRLNRLRSRDMYPSLDKVKEYSETEFFPTKTNSTLSSSELLDKRGLPGAVSVPSAESPSSHFSPHSSQNKEKDHKRGFATSGIYDSSSSGCEVFLLSPTPEQDTIEFSLKSGPSEVQVVDSKSGEGSSFPSLLPNLHSRPMHQTKESAMSAAINSSTQESGNLVAVPLCSDNLPYNRREDKSGSHIRSRRRFRYARHGGVDEVVDKSEVRPEMYGLPSTSFNGSLECIKLEEELPHTFINEHSSVYHSGMSSTDPKESFFGKLGFGTNTRQEKEDSSSSSGDDSEEEDNSAHLKKAPQVEHERSNGLWGNYGGGGFLSFWRGVGRKSKEDAGQQECVKPDETATETSVQTNQGFSEGLASRDAIANLKSHEHSVSGFAQFEEGGAELRNGVLCLALDQEIPAEDFPQCDVKKSHISQDASGLPSITRNTELIGEPLNAEIAPSVVESEINNSSLRPDRTGKSLSATGFDGLCGGTQASVGSSALLHSAEKNASASPAVSRLAPEPEVSGCEQNSREGKENGSQLSDACLLSGGEHPWDHQKPAGGQISDEAYHFSSTPPNCMDNSAGEAPHTLIGYIKRRITQTIPKGSFEKDKKKKDKKKKKGKKGATRESESSSSSDSEKDALLNALSDAAPKEQGKDAKSTSDKDAASTGGRILLEQRVEESYHLKGTGLSPTLDPSDTQESSPHTTIDSWHETTVGPESVVTDVDQHGNIIKRTVKTQQVKHTVQKQTYQTYTVPNEGGERGMQTVEASQQLITPVGGTVVASATSPVIETRTHTVAYESVAEPGGENGFESADIPGELVSSRTITSGNRTVETITYKTEKDGVVETHVEHRVTIHSGDDIDHDAELSQAILEATNMNPDMTVEKIEVKQESQC